MTTWQGFGEEVDHLISALVLEQKWTKKRALAYIAEQTNFAETTIYRWRQGRLRPRDETIETLARVAEQSGKLDRAWGKSFLQASRYPQVEDLLYQIWGPEHLRLIPNNLPKREHTTFIGRQVEIERLLQLLSPEHAAHLISVDGIGGVGKTALVLEVAHRCLETSRNNDKNESLPSFDAIIFATAKQYRLTPDGIRPRTHFQRTLRDIFHEIAYTLDRPEITRTTPEEQPMRVHRALARQKTLLIVDNLETMLDRQGIMDALYDMPPSVKVIITTREQALPVPIRLSHLSQDEGIELIYHEVENKNAQSNTQDVRTTLTKEQASDLYVRTGGIPAAIIYAIGQLAFGYTVETILERLAQHHGDIARFCFETSITPIKGTATHYLLMAIAIFPKRPLREAVITVAGLGADPLTAEECLVQLQRLSLIRQQEDRYVLLPLTREFGLAELAAYSQFEQAARRRWVEWYIQFSNKYGGDDEWEWHIQYDRIEEEWENFLAVFEWCTEHSLLDELKHFWLDQKLGEFANIYGYWDDRSLWLSGITQLAERRGEIEIIARALSNHAWVYLLMAKPEQLREGEELLQKAWEYSKYTEVLTKLSVVNHFVVLTLREIRCTEAEHWLNIQSDLLNQLEPSNPDFNRRKFILQYYQAELFYKQGELAKSESLYEEILEFARRIKWHRAILYTQNWLADIAIHNKEFEKAESYLRLGLPVIERNKDKRRTALYKRSYALLEYHRGNSQAAETWARSALDGFDRLGMQPEAEEIRVLLRKLSLN